jgi:hypothetical protein
LKATLEKGPTDGWIIGSNEVATIKDSWSHGRCLEIEKVMRLTNGSRTIFDPLARLAGLVLSA